MAGQPDPLALSLHYLFWGCLRTPAPHPHAATTPSHTHTPPSAAEQTWWGNHGIWVGESLPPGDPRSYAEFLASSVFCIAPLGVHLALQDGATSTCIAPRGAQL